MESLTVFTFESQEVRFIDGFPVANDVARALGYADPAKTISTKVNQDYKWVAKMATTGGIQSVTILKEPGIYQLIFSSKLESAKRFQKWTFEEVLPSIRKNGNYGNQKRSLSFAEKIELILQMPEKTQISFIKTQGNIVIEREKTKQAEIELQIALIEEQSKTTVIKEKLNEKERLKQAILNKMEHQKILSITATDVVTYFRRYKLHNSPLCVKSVLEVFAEMQAEGLGCLDGKRFKLPEKTLFIDLPVSTTH